MALFGLLPAPASSFPWIGCIRANFPNGPVGGTGSLIAPRLVLTAAHVLYDAVHWGGKVQSVTVTFGGAVAVPGSLVDFPKEWRSGVDTSVVSPYDLGVIQLRDRIDSIAPIAVQVATDAVLTGRLLSVGGFPIAPGVPFGSLYGQSFNVIQDGALGGFAQYESWRLFYPVDTVEGMSGGPVYDVDPSSKMRILRGIHTSMIDGFSASALRINQSNLPVVQKWILEYGS
jgi:V8-like Glu-specific endopeptidase